MSKKMRITVISLLSVVFAVSVGFLVKDYCDSKMQAELYDNLIETVEDTDDTEDTMSYSEDKNFLPDYQELYMQNNDMVGWIKVEDTKINYPVMQSKDNPNFYLRHGFDKGYTVYGCPYVQENCDVDAPSDNLVIYGHHMNDNSMFAGLMKYADKSFWEKHKTIQFDTLTEKGKYTDFIFVNRFGQPQHQATLNKAIRRIIRNCNDKQFLESENPEVLLPHFSCHSLRHTFTTRMCEAGVNVKVIQDALGHKDVSTTLNIYTDVTKELRKSEFEGLELQFNQ